MTLRPQGRVRRGRLRPVGEALTGLVRELGDEAALSLAWRRAVWLRLAQRTRVVGLEGGVLRVAVPDESWATHLGRMARSLLPRVGETLGRAVRRLSFEVHAELRASEPAPRPEAPAPAPGEAEWRVVREAGIARPGLAEAVARAMAAHARAK